MATAALLGDNKRAGTLIPVLGAARSKAATDAERANIDILLVDAYFALERWDDALAAAAGMLRAYPDSDMAYSGYCFAAFQLKGWKALEEASRNRAERNPDDEISLIVRSESAAEQGSFAKALQVLRTRISNPKASIGLLNNYAWDALYLDPVPGDAAEIAQRAARLTENKDFGVVHTLAAVYAEIGRPAEARKLILDVMDQTGLDEPNEAAWYVFGRIAEQYGQREAALTAYTRTKPPKR